MTQEAFVRTLDAQRRAADPARSVLVSANAGSGKTRVLTNRVARLLLAGAPPERILCITFTKAAAAEMSERLFALLGAWALMDDARLKEALSTLSPGLADDYDTEDFGRARRLFAQALETPGGLKIQTIHSFCQALLARFPMEAGFAPGFAVIEEADAAALQRDAIDKVAARAGGGEGALAAAINRLGRRGAAGVREMATSALASPSVRDALVSDGYETALLSALGANADQSAEEIMRDAVSSTKPETLTRLIEAMEFGGSTARERQPMVITARDSSDPVESFRLLTNTLLTQKEELNSKIITKGMEKADGGVRDLAEGVATRLGEALGAIRAAETYADAAALARVVRDASTVYDRAKAARGALDFDDLIDRAARLLGDRERAAWVMWKLDQGLEHILVDEAQDTSPRSWDVIEAPLAEFFAGAGAEKERERTFFAVGDPKQSIYSFQGADAELFQEKLVDLGAKIAAVAPFSNIDLTLSFRTTPPVLSFVDALFENRATREGLADDLELRHEAFRRNEPGLVELWPLAPATQLEDATPWDAPLDAVSEESRERRLALAVAGKVRELIDGAAIPDGDGGERPVTPSDIMLLVQTRGPVFTETIRALTQAGAPTAGADVLDLLDDQATLDLMSFARAAVSEADDLSLAEALKSPFFGADEEALFSIAYGRKGTLRAALKEACADGRAPADWHQNFEAARRIGLSDGPVAFFSHLLDAGAPTGRARLLHRLGAPSRDPIDAFMGQAYAFERLETRSLRGFIRWITERGAQAKRDADQSDDVIRVTTVHKSKGLEAPIVFMLETQKPPRLRPDHILIGADRARAATPIRTPAKEAAPKAAIDGKAEAQRLAYNEYRRLLYVAATRARDRLYICGIENKKLKDDAPPERRVWAQLARDAFDRLKDAPAPGCVLDEANELWDAPILRYGDPALVHEEPQKTRPARTLADARETRPPPAHLFHPPAPERPPLRLSPTRLADLVEAAGEVGGAAAGYRPATDKEALSRGRVIHRLLEIPAALERAEWEEAADRLAARLAPDATSATRADWTREARAVLDDPTFAAAFGPAARAEAVIGGDIEGPRGPIRISGRIDRLAVSAERVLVIDFKTNRPPPQRAEDAAPAYLAQMGAYRALLRRAFPDRRVEAALLWTFEARLTPLPAALIDAAFSRALSAIR
ncbi:MAG: double-strand break repair helicase AddA [Pseudomonadota bacterium]